MIRRRDFITLLGGAAALAPLAAYAQEPDRVYRLGILHQLPRSAAQFATLLDGLRRQGFLEGRNLAVDPRGFDSRSEQYQERAADIIKSGVDVLFCGGDATLRAAQRSDCRRCGRHGGIGVSSFSWASGRQHDRLQYPCDRT